jgi:hypothetical protein
MSDLKKYPVEGFSNVFVLRNPNSHTPTDRYIFTTSPMFRLLTELTAKRPTWEFTSIHMVRRSDGVITCNQFDVYEKGERIGDITTGWSNRRGGAAEPDYRYDTPRLEKDRQRGSWTKTTDLDKAVKGILKAFTPKTLSERIEVAEQVISSHVRSAAARHVNGFNNIWRNSAFEIMDYVVANWETINEGMVAMGLTPPPEEARDIYLKARGSNQMLKAYNADEGVLVLIRGNDYIVVRGSDEMRTTEILSSEQLPPVVRRNIGILKLHGEGMVFDVGVLDGDDVFYVYTEEVS